MAREHMRLERLAAVVLVVAGGAWLLAGPLNPPAGPVSAGGKTTQEIYDAVTGINGSIGAVGGRGPAVPGGNASGGSLAMVSAQPVSGPIIGMRMSVASSVGAGGNVGIPVMSATGITVVREVGSGSASAWRLCVSRTHSQSATITLNGVGGNTTYLLTDVVIVGYRDYLVQRADGTMGAIEELDLYPVSVRVTEPSGTTWTYNFSTGQGG